MIYQCLQMCPAIAEPAPVGPAADGGLYERSSGLGALQSAGWTAAGYTASAPYSTHPAAPV